MIWKPPISIPHRAWPWHFRGCVAIVIACFGTSLGLAQARLTTGSSNPSLGSGAGGTWTQVQNPSLSSPAQQIPRAQAATNHGPGSHCSPPLTSASFVSSSPPMLGAPFTLTPEEEATLLRVLQRWEEATSRVKNLECRFTRFQYDPVFGSGTTPVAVDQGEIKYVAPNKGLFRVFQPQNFAEPRAEQWICDGKAIYEFDYANRQLIEYPLPPEAQNRPVSEGPLPFVFGAKAAELRDRYYLRVVTPSHARGQVWLEAWPKWQNDATNFQRATMIILWEDMTPFALELIEPNGKNRTVFRFQEVKINARNILDPLGLFEESWLRPRTPPGWTRVVRELSATQAAQRP